MFTLTKELFEEMSSRFLILRQFISDSQRRELSRALRGEEAEFFIDKVREISDIFRSMPKTYETDGQGMKLWYRFITSKTDVTGS